MSYERTPWLRLTKDRKEQLNYVHETMAMTACHEVSQKVWFTVSEHVLNQVDVGLWSRRFSITEEIDEYYRQRKT